MGHLITGAKGQAHITPKSDAVWHRGMMGVESCILDYGEKLAPALVPSQPTNIRILDGCGMMQGRFFEIEEGSYDTIAIPNGAQGYNRIDIVCAKITQNENGTQSFSWEVVQGTQTTGTPTPPTVEEGSLDDGDEFALMPIASVELEGVSIVAVETVAEIAPTLDEVKTQRVKRTVLWENYSLTSAYGDTDIDIGTREKAGTTREWEITFREWYEVASRHTETYQFTDLATYEALTHTTKRGIASDDIVGYFRGYWINTTNPKRWLLHLTDVYTVKANAARTVGVDRGMLVPIKVVEIEYI